MLQYLIPTVIDRLDFVFLQLLDNFETVKKGWRFFFSHSLVKADIWSQSVCGEAQLTLFLTSKMCLTEAKYYMHITLQQILIILN